MTWDTAEKWIANGLAIEIERDEKHLTIKTKRYGYHITCYRGQVLPVK